MSRTKSIHPTRAGLALAGLATLALALAACSGASQSPTSNPSPTASPSPTGAPSPSPAPVTASLAATNQPQTIHLIEHPTNVGHVQVGSLTGCTGASGCQGDYLVGNDPMFDAATGKEVGSIMFECFLVDPGSGMFHCPGITIELTGRGQIVFTERFDGSSQASPITGGPGEFLGATGTVTAKLPPSGNGDFVITIDR